MSNGKKIVEKLIIGSTSTANPYKLVKIEKKYHNYLLKKTVPYKIYLKLA